MFTIIPHAQQMFKDKEKHILRKHCRVNHLMTPALNFLIPNIKPKNSQNWEQKQAQMSTILKISAGKINKGIAHYYFTI